MFAKLFDTPLGQLLATKEFDEDEDGAFRICLRGESIKGADPSMTLGWPTEDERDQVFEKLDQSQANGTAAELASILGNFMGQGTTS